MNKRVHQIAKERGLPPKDVLARLRAAGVDVTASSSSVDEDLATRVLGAGNGSSATNGGNGASNGGPANGGNGPANGGNGAAGSGAGNGATTPAARPRPSTAGLRRVTISDSGPGQRRSTPRRSTPSAPAEPSPAEAARAAAEAAQAARARAQAAGDPRRQAASGRPGRPAPVPRLDPRTPPAGDPRRGQAGDPRRGQAADGRRGQAADGRRDQSGATTDPRRGQGARALQGQAPQEVDARASLPQRQQGLGGTDQRRGGAQGVPRGPRPQGGPRRQPTGPTPGAVAREAAAAVGRAREVAADPRTQRGNAGRPQAAPAARVEPAADPAQTAANDAAKQRPTRDSLQGERAPGNAGGRRRVVIDSQASRRQAGGPPPAANQPPRRQRRGRRRRGTYDDAVESQPKNSIVEAGAIQIISGSTVKDVAEYLDVSTSEIIKKLMALGEMRTLTQTLSDETIEVLATELGKDVEIVHSEDEEVDEELYADADEDLVERAPVVTIMGHVDHGKTSLLDAIRETSVAAGEAGGITQHIGAYQVEHGGHEITFLDTPGHEAFTAMRARGARVTDIAVIVVAADDGVKPQTQEAVDHAKEAEVPILVAVNKVDKEGAQPDRVRAEMAQLGLQPVQWGGDTEFVDVSAKTRQGLEDLLETIVVMAEVEELKANPNAPASGSVIESKLDPGRGPVVTILVSRGTLKVGDALVAGAQWGRVRAMQDYLGQRVTQAKPGEPVEVLGFDGVPEAGEHVRVVEHERRARQLATERATRLKAESLARVGSGKRVSLENIFGSDLQELNLVLKADVAGSLEAIEDEIAKLPQDEVSVNVIRRAVGAVTESDVMLAAASDAVILAFNVRPVGDARAAAEREGVEIRSYSVIYRAIEELRQAMQGMLAPEEVEEALGSAEVRQIFRASRVGTIAGSYVTEGRITRGSKVRLVRDGTVIWDGEIASLRRFNEDAREVASGFECGIVLRDYADVKEGDVLETYTTRQVERELA